MFLVVVDVKVFCILNHWHKSLKLIKLVLKFDRCTKDIERFSYFRFNLWFFELNFHLIFFNR